MKPRQLQAQCFGCGGWFTPESHTNILYPVCDGCLATQKGQHETGRTVWRAYLLTDLTDQGIGPFLTRTERNAFFATMHHTHPHLMEKARDIRCFEEPVSGEGEVGT